MHFYSLESLTSVNIFSDIMLNLGPPVIAGDKFCSLVTARVSSKGRVVVFADDVFSELGMNGNIDAFLESDKPVL